MTGRCNLFFTTAMLAALSLSGIEPASAQKSPIISPPHISPMRPDFNMRAPDTLRDRDVSDPGEATIPKKKANRGRSVEEKDYRERAGALPSVHRANTSRPGKKTKSVRRPGGASGASGISVVSDRVLKTGSSISGGWREYSVDRSWRRVVFTLEDHTATIVFSDGMPGRRLPSMTHFVRSGPKDSPGTYHEARIFAGASPGIGDKAKQSSPIPSDVATRIRGLGVDFRLLQQLMDDKRGFAEVGRAFDAARGARDAGGLFPDRPGGSPGKGNWSAPWRGVGSDGRASGDGKVPSSGPDEVISTDERQGTDGSTDSTVVVRHGDGSTSTTSTWADSEGSGTGTVEKNKDGEVTGGSSVVNRVDGSATSTTYKRDTRTGQIRYENTTHDAGGVRTRSGIAQRGTPPESGSRGGFDEAWLYRLFPWMMDAYYHQWKRESDLVQSGGRISQPGGQPTLVFNDSPEVGADAVVNCGASDSNPCAGPAGVAVDPRGGFRSISQPGRGVGPDAPAETGPPPPIPEPAPQ